VTSGEPLFNSINAGKPFGSGAPPGPGRWGSSQRSPRPLAGCRGPLRGGREGEGKGEGRGGKEEKEGWEGEEEMEGRDGKDHGAAGFRRRAASYFCGAATVENLLSRRRFFTA
jgi:hypothetical protein